MKITESQLRSVIRQVIVEESLNESIPDKYILGIAAAVLAAAGLFGKITGGTEDINNARSVSNEPEVTQAIKSDALRDLNQGAPEHRSQVFPGYNEIILNQ
jgi:hypothetical protein